MKKNLLLVLSLCAGVMLTSCKSRESAYRQAYEQAMAQDNQTANEQQIIDQQPIQDTVTPVTTVTPVKPTTPSTPVVEDHSDVREINAEMYVVSGNPLKTYSVVVGSFINQSNAEGQRSGLVGKGYDARVVKTNETINGTTGWFRVIASSYDDKASAVQSRQELRNNFPGAWLLYRKK